MRVLRMHLICAGDYKRTNKINISDMLLGKVKKWDLI